MKVFIITEGSKDIGFGHITRCTSLYQAFEEKNIIPEFIINGDETVKYLLKNTNHKLFNWLKEKNRLLALINAADITIIDSYLMDYSFYKEISGLVKSPVYIDDNKRIDYPRGIVINGTTYAEELGYPAREDVMYLLGSQYIPLRKAFWDIGGKKIKEDINNIMITFGGEDVFGMTEKVLSCVVKNYPEIIKNVIIGRGFRDIHGIKELADTKTNLIYYPDADGMKAIMIESDLAISASGQTLYELARTGLPVIAIADADNQMNNVKGLKKAEFIEYAGWYEDVGLIEKVLVCFENLKDFKIRRERSLSGQKLVDGYGSKKIVSFLLAPGKNLSYATN